MVKISAKLIDKRDSGRVKRFQRSEMLPDVSRSSATAASQAVPGTAVALLARAATSVKGDLPCPRLNDEISLSRRATLATSKPVDDDDSRLSTQVSNASAENFRRGTNATVLLLLFSVSNQINNTLLKVDKPQLTKTSSKQGNVEDRTISVNQLNDHYRPLDSFCGPNTVIV